MDPSGGDVPSSLDNLLNNLLGELEPAGSTEATPMEIEHVEPPPWEERIKTLAPKGIIRLLDPPRAGLEQWWKSDRSLTEWIRETTDQAEGVALFTENQKKRWLARAVQMKWTKKVWEKKVQCNVDMITMEPVQDADAIHLTDTTNRCIYRFHRRDIYSNILANICQSDEMMPYPRQPTNPWNNIPLTLAQTISAFQQLVADYAKRGSCPPVLFSAFWAARFDIQRFRNENVSTLSHHAIVSYFKDIHDHNIETICDTIFQLLADAGIDYSSIAMRRWLRQTPVTPIHREWLAFARDYTLYLNLHVQARAHWRDSRSIYRDVRALYQRTSLPNPAGPRLQYLTAVANDIGPLLSLTHLLNINNNISAVNTYASVLMNPGFQYGAGAGATGSADLSGNQINDLVTSLLNQSFH
jgi:hypothetical protein